MILIFLGQPPEQMIMEYFDYCIDEKAGFQQMYDILAISDNYGLTCTREMATRLKNSMSIMSDHESKLIHDFINAKPSYNVTDVLLEERF